MRLATALAIAALAAAPLAGCGSSSDGSDGAGSTAAPKDGGGSAPAGASAHACAIDGGSASGLRVTAVSCGRAQKTVLAWQEDAACRPAGSGSQAGCTVAGYRCIATATDQGLLVPVIRDVDTSPIADVVARARAVVGRARAGKPGGDDLSGATFTISNLGMFPVSHFAAVVNPPQAAILAVGTIRDVPIVRGGAVVPGKLMTVTLSCDHRVVDGALAGRFLGELKALIENPLALVV